MKYQVILADPPWTYADKASAGNRGACFKYPLMTTEDIMDLRVKGKLIKDITADDCVLFMWVTLPKLNEVFDVIKAWGFTYKTGAFTWVKKTKKGKVFIGMGRWTRANAELCLLATKGKPKRFDAGIRQIIETVPEKHSKKPDETRLRIERLCGKVPRIELFARQKTRGWAVFGNEVK